MKFIQITYCDAVEGISVTPEEADKINLTSKIFLKSGDQAVILGYFHNLHCIVSYKLTVWAFGADAHYAIIQRYLYQGLHPEIYRQGQDSAHSGFGHSCKYLFACGIIKGSFYM